MPKSYTTLFFAIVLGLLSFSCTQTNSSVDKKTLARVGNEYLTVAEAKSNIPDFVYEKDSVAALQRYRQEWINQKVQINEAQRLGLAEKKEVRKKIQKAKEEVLREALRDYVLASQEDKSGITDQEARTFYQANKKQFVLDEEFVQFRHMQARTIQDARSAKRDLLRGISWTEVARDYAINDKAAIEKADQYQPISMALSDIDIMNRYLKIIGHNEISPIQRVNGVYHFVQLTDSRAKGELPDLDWLIEKIKGWMQLDRQRRNFSSYAKNLYLKAKSNNEVESFNVLPSQPNQNNIPQDTLESNPTDE
ncbi:PPIC-type PPIASE domain-containing protein [Fodinibius salinus]|uniref:PPIC-type PPIASE domain-containing protein n=1 Tax=Fodinibius salinus TaxID=860790 RepID=A0A5D3YMT9_9BACT|nr:peptidyl-prolyl cis-trans isomerase [Fodinibius salinus]TYP95220.1 PPIC-type PPIASE domain-containing protein [Fodinibius salinus]